MIDRTISWMRRYLRAREYGLPYLRDKYWQLPTSLKVDKFDQLLCMPRDHGTAIAFKDIFLDDVYGLKKNRWEVGTILDIGAHAGLFSLYARTLYPQATIHAYEPNPAMWQYLAHQSKLGKFVAFAEAVGRVAGKATLSIGEDTVFTKTVGSPEGTIYVTSFADAVARLGGKVELLKMDCEGAEWDILLDSNTLSLVKYLTLEYHLFNKHTIAELIGILSENGFQIMFMHEDGPDNGRIWATRKSER